MLKFTIDESTEIRLIKNLEWLAEDTETRVGHPNIFVNTVLLVDTIVYARTWEH